MIDVFVDQELKRDNPTGECFRVYVQIFIRKKLKRDTFTEECFRDESCSNFKVKHYILKQKQYSLKQLQKNQAFDQCRPFFNIENPSRAISFNFIKF